jgi:predicted deacetylase
MKYIIRLDDICPTMDWDKFWKIKEILMDGKIKPLLCIIPDNKDIKLQVSSRTPFSIYRKEIDSLIHLGWEISQHGTTHTLTQKGGVLKISDKGELPGISSHLQRDIIEDGKKIFEDYGWQTDYFSPPAHAYDENTIKALIKLDFKVLLDGIGIFPWQDGLLYLPLIWWQPKELPLPFSKMNGVTQICLHPNTITEKQLDDLKTFVKKHNNKITSVKEVASNYREISRLQIESNKLVKKVFYTKLKYAK